METLFKSNESDFEIIKIEDCVFAIDSREHEQEDGPSYKTWGFRPIAGSPEYFSIGVDRVLKVTPEGDVEEQDSETDWYCTFAYNLTNDRDGIDYHRNHLIEYLEYVESHGEFDRLVRIAWNED